MKNEKTNAAHKRREGRILIVDDDEDLALSLADILESRGYQVEIAHSAQAAQEKVQDFDAQVALLDVRLRRTSGIDLIASLEEIRPGILCVTMTAYAAMDTAIEAIRRGAYDYLQKPLNIQYLLASLERCFEKLWLESEKDAAEKTLRQRNRELGLLNRVGRALNSTLELSQVLVAVLEGVRRLLNIVACSIWLIEPETNELVCQQTIGPHSEVVRGWRLAPGQGIAGWVAQHGESLIVPDASADERHFEGIDQQIELVLRSFLTVPLRVKENTIGALQVMDTEADRFKQTDLLLVEALAANAAIAIENARLYTFNEDIVQNMEEGILVEDASGCITFANPKTLELLGYEIEELMGQHYTLTVAPEEVTRIEDETARRSQGIASRYETTLLTKEGQRVPVIVSATPLFDGGAFTGVLAVFTDITERKRQETRLQEYLSSVTGSLALHTSLEGLHQFIVEAGAKLLSAHDCSLFLTHDEDDDMPQLVATTPASPGADRACIAGAEHGRGLVDYVTDTCQPVRLLGEEVLQHSLWNRDLWARLGWDFDPEKDHSLLAVPMCTPDGRMAGVLVARDARQDEGFSEFDEVLLRTLATNAAADIERVRRMEKVREDAIRTERKRLEADLHEAMNTLATGVRWEAEILSDEIERNDLGAADVSLNRLQAALARAYTDLRSLLEDLRDPTLEQEGLLVALTKRAELIGHGRISVYGNLEERLLPAVEGALYRIGQEAMTNAVKHSEFVHDSEVKIQVQLEQEGNRAKLCVRDDGVGFDVESTLALPHKWGLRRLYDMVHEVGGELEIDSAPGEGTTICATIDLERA